jgi:hypothetical protein
MNYCEFPIWMNGWPKTEECGQPACTKIDGMWFCVLHEDAAESLMQNALDELEDLDCLIEAVPEEDCDCCNYDTDDA